MEERVALDVCSLLSRHTRTMTMLPGVGVFGTESSALVLVPLLRAEGFSIEALWGKTEEEAKQLAEEMNISFYSSRTDDVLLHQDVDLVCINIPPPLTRQIAVKALGTAFLLSTQSTVLGLVSKNYFSFSVDPSGDRMAAE